MPKYDCDGNRVAKIVGTNTTTFLVDENNPTGYAQVLEEKVNGSLVRTYAFGTGLLSEGQFSGGAWKTSYYAFDGHGSTRFLSDATGTATDFYTYDAFGNLVYKSGTTANAYLYCGEQYDSDLGMYDLRARYMELGRGRFWSMDDYEGVNGDPASLHKYLYCNSDPSDRIDRNGNESLLELADTLAIQAYTNLLAFPRVYAVVSFTLSLVVPAEVEFGLPSFGGGSAAAIESAAAKELPALRLAWPNANSIKEAGVAGRSFEQWVGKVLNLEKNTLAFKNGAQVKGGTPGSRIYDFFASGVRDSIVEVKSASFDVGQAKEFARIASQQGSGLTYIFLKNPGAAAVRELRKAVASVDPDLEVAVNVVFP
jgi:RHS repeat-associated protein